MFQKVVWAPEEEPASFGPLEWKPREEAPRLMPVNRIWAVWALQRQRKEVKGAKGGQRHQRH